MTGFAERSDGLNANDVAGKAQPGDLYDRHRLYRDQVLRRSVEQGEADGGKRHQPDRLQS
jgi:hypothetical protein